MTWYFINCRDLFNRSQKLNFIQVYGERHSNFSSHVIEEGREMKNVHNIMTILYKENNHEKINKLEEIEILREPAS